MALTAAHDARPGSIVDKREAIWTEPADGLIPVPFVSFAVRPSLRAKRSNPGAAATLWIASPVLRSRVPDFEKRLAMTGRANEAIERKPYDLTI
jgi:hypothetical protein